MLFFSNRKLNQMLEKGQPMPPARCGQLYFFSYKATATERLMRPALTLHMNHPILPLTVSCSTWHGPG